jgi:dihydrodipicolinate synthase/N-acetylneuraminate lyase
MEEKTMKWSRREVLRDAALVIAGAGAEALGAHQARRSPLSPSDLKKRIRGPILSAPTVYTTDSKVDDAGMRAMVELGVRAGVRVFALTAGNSQYSVLSYDEIKALTRTMVDAAANRGVVIAATGPWWTDQAVDYARFAESAGADAVQVLLPPEGSDAAHLEHFRAVARATRLGLVVHGKPSLALLEKLAGIESVVALKEEFTPDYTLQAYRKLGDRLNIFAGGTKWRFLQYQPYGMTAYYSVFVTFAPEVAMRFWGAVERNDIPAARDVILKYDLPFFERWNHPFWRATLEHFGIAKRFVRPPAQPVTDGQMQEIRAFYDGLGLRKS